MKSIDQKSKEIKYSKNVSKKKKSALRRVLNGLLWTLIIGFLVYSGLKVADVKTGYKVLPTHTAVIISDSMSRVHEDNYYYLDKDVPHIMKEDIVYTVNYSSFDDVKNLDIVIYLDREGGLICHRVIDKYVYEGIPYVVTRGDANNVDDAPVRYDLVRGHVYNVTKGGNIVLFIQSPFCLLALCCGGFFILLGYFIYSYNDEKKLKNQKSLKEKRHEK